VSRLRFIGDVILTTPVVHALRKHFPDAKISYLAEKPYHSLLFHHPDVDQVFGFDSRSLRNQACTIRDLLRIPFDVAIDLFGNPRSAWLAFMSGARYRIGGDFRGRKAFYTHKIRDDGKPKSAIDFHLEYLRPLGIEIERSEPHIEVTEEETALAWNYLEKEGFSRNETIIGVHPGATWPAKKWPGEKFAGLANRLVTELGVKVLFTTGVGEEDLVGAVIKECSFPTASPIVLTLRQLVALIKVIHLFISNDTGPMHIAPAVGTPCIGIFGPGEPEIWFPYKSSLRHRFIHAELECSRCHLDYCDRMDCMKAITEDDVFDVVVQLLQKEGKTV
jgi:ADP-heptose:LPS heptosyltransferase